MGVNGQAFCSTSVGFTLCLYSTKVSGQDVMEFTMTTKRNSGSRKMGWAAVGFGTNMNGKLERNRWAVFCHRETNSEISLSCLILAAEVYVSRGKRHNRA